MEQPELQEIVEAYALAVYRLAYARTGNRDDAEDIVQEVFLRLVRATPELHDGEHAKAWLLRVTVNCTNSFFRSPWKKRVEPLSDTLATPAPDEARGEVLDAVLSLPRQYRAAVHLFYYEEFSVREIARVLGRSEQAVKNLLHRARGRLRDKLKGGAEDVSGIV